MSGDSISVAVVDDQLLVRSGLSMLINSQPDITVVGEAADGSAAVELVRRLVRQSQGPDVVMMDVRMPTLNGLEAARQILELTEHTKIIMLTTFDIDEYVFEAIQLGASGFLLKDAPPEDLLNAIRTVHRGDGVIAPSATKRLMENMVPLLASSAQPVQVKHRQEIASLTAREREVLELVATGLTNGEICARLFLSEATVKTHISHILAKLSARDRVQAVIMAYEAGLVS